MPDWTRTLAVTFAALALAFSVSRIPRPDLTPATAPLPAEVDRIHISGAALDGAVALVFEDGRWRLAEPLSYPADQENAASLLAALRNLKVEAVLSRRPAAHALFHVDDKGGIRLAARERGSAKETVWIIGKNAPDNLRVYVRRPDEDEVYLARGFLRDGVQVTADHWRDQRLLPLDPGAQAVSVRVRRGRTAFQLDTSEGVFTVDGRPADKARVEPLWNSLFQGTVSSFVDPPKSLDPDLFSPAGEILVALADGGEHRLVLGQKEADGARLVRRGDEPSLLLVPDTALALFTASPKDLDSQ